MKSYLLVFDNTSIERDRLLQIIDQIEEIRNWQAFLTNCVALVSELEVKEIGEKIRDVRDEKEKFQFFVVPFSRGASSGWLAKSVWTFLNNPRPVE